LFKIPKMKKAIFFAFVLAVACAPKTASVVTTPPAPTPEPAAEPFAVVQPQIGPQPLPEPGISTDADVVATGKSIYDNACIACHNRVEPSRFTWEQWQPIMRSMSHKANLDASQTAAVLAYVHSEVK
jgi:mono/diheme cytochrome c family protein